MRVLFVTNPTSVNPYTKTLMKGIMKCDDRVICDICLLAFWKTDVFGYDIIHVMWPAELLLPYDRFNHKSSDDLLRRLKEIKSKNIKVVSTCHNLVPHYTSNKEKIEAYNVVYNNSDMIIHLGSYSKELFEKSYPMVLHKLLMHHVYDDYYDVVLNQKESKKRLGLSNKSKYILCFGNIRSCEERRLVHKIADYYDGKGIKVLCPSYSLVAKRKNLLIVLKSYFYFIYRSIKERNIIIRKDVVPDNELPLYFQASDIVFIPRLKILNSGNIPMAMLMGRAVVGPDCGNVGPFLRAVGNMTFSVSDFESVIIAINRCLEENPENLGKKNRDFAMGNMTTLSVANQLLVYYRGLII